jgi:hypothetical protein
VVNVVVVGAIAVEIAPARVVVVRVVARVVGPEIARAVAAPSRRPSPRA